MRRFFDILLKDEEDDYEIIGQPTLLQIIFEFLATATMFLAMFTMLLVCLSMLE